MTNKLSHLDDKGNIKMVDVSAKQVTSRTAIASGKILLNDETILAIQTQANPKGDPLEIARIAGVMGAKKTSELIPLCHQLNLSKVDIHAEINHFGVYVQAVAKTNSQTGVEMEALTAVSVACLTIYDMCKAVQKDIQITDIQLESKMGGKSNYKRK